MSEVVSPHQMRIFVALSVPHEVKTEMAKAQGELRQALSVLGQKCVRWTRQEQLHLTLKFFGNVDASRIDSLVEDVRGACRALARLRLRAEGIGCFPDLRHPRVIWAGVGGREGKLQALQCAVAGAVRDYTQESVPEVFSGHVTVGRLKELGCSEAAMLARLAAGMATRSFGEWTADKVEVMRSELSAQGAQHSCIAAVSLSDVA